MSYRQYHPSGHSRWGAWFPVAVLNEARAAASRQGLTLSEWMRQVVRLALKSLREA